MAEYNSNQNAISVEKRNGNVLKIDFGVVKKKSTGGVPLLKKPNDAFFLKISIQRNEEVARMRVLIVFICLFGPLIKVMAK